MVVKEVASEACNLRVRRFTRATGSVWRLHHFLVGVALGTLMVAVVFAVMG